jgi:hypothetical protein
MGVTYLHTSPCTGKLAKSNTKKKIWTEKTDAKKIELITEWMVPFILWGAGIWIYRYPTTENNCYAARPQNVDAASVRG